MESHASPQEVPRDPVGQILTYEGRSIALVDLGGDASDALRASWSTERPFHSGGLVESAWMLPMLGAGSTAASSLLAGNVFLATANPATLMTIGTGVGSAVLGPAGIVAQAPFVAATGALIPVLAPVMLFTTVSSVMMSARLDRVQRTLGRLSEVVEDMRCHLEAEDYARFENAAVQIEDMSSEFAHCQRLANDVPNRLSLVEGNREPAAFQVRTPDDQRRSFRGHRKVGRDGSQSLLPGKSLRYSGRRAPVVLGAPERS